MLETGAVITFRPDSDAVVIQRKHQNNNALLYEILGSGATIDTSQVSPCPVTDSSKIKKIDVLIDGDKNRIISPFETYVTMRGDKNIIGSGSNDDNFHIVDANNIFANVTDRLSKGETVTNSIKFGSLTRPSLKNNNQNSVV